VLWFLLLVLLIAWILGLAGIYKTAASVSWLLLGAAVAVLLLQLISGGRRV
jgi:hypothetical protein